MKSFETLTMVAVSAVPVPELAVIGEGLASTRLTFTTNRPIDTVASARALTIFLLLIASGNS